MVKLSDLKPADQVHAEMLDNPEHRREYERTAFANAVATRIIEFRAAHGLSSVRTCPKARDEAAGDRPTRGRGSRAITDDSQSDRLRTRHRVPHRHHALQARAAPGGLIGSDPGVRSAGTGKGIRRRWRGDEQRVDERHRAHRRGWSAWARQGPCARPEGRVRGHVAPARTYRHGVRAMPHCRIREVTRDAEQLVSKFAMFFSYTPETWAKMIGNPNDRTAAVTALVEGVGGKLEALYYMLGDRDGFVVFDAPDPESAGALALAVNSSGAFNSGTDQSIDRVRRPDFRSAHGWFCPRELPTAWRIGHQCGHVPPRPGAVMVQRRAARRPVPLTSRPGGGRPRSTPPGCRAGWGP